VQRQHGSNRGGQGGWWSGRKAGARGPAGQGGAAGSGQRRPNPGTVRRRQVTGSRCVYVCAPVARPCRIRARARRRSGPCGHAMPRRWSRGYASLADSSPLVGRAVPGPRPPLHAAPDAIATPAAPMAIGRSAEARNCSREGRRVHEQCCRPLMPGRFLLASIGSGPSFICFARRGDRFGSSVGMAGAGTVSNKIRLAPLKPRSNVTS